MCKEKSSDTFVYGGVKPSAGQPRRPADKMPFTLTELLVIIAIIVMLVTILLPALETAIIISHGSVCKNQMKNIGSGLAMYTSDWNGRFFGSNGDPNIVQSDYDNPAAGSDGRGYCWARRLYNAGYYAKTGKTNSGPTTWDCDEAWKCPEYKRFNGNTWSSHASYYGTQNMMKWAGGPPANFYNNEPVIWYDIPSPMKRAVVVEFEADVHYAWGGPYFEWQLVVIGFPGFPGSTQLGNIAFDLWNEGHPMYHLGNPNFLYADFHVDRLNRREFWQVCNIAIFQGGRPLLAPFD